MLVPSVSMKVVGRLVKGSVSFDAIQTNRGERSSLVATRPAFTKCQRRTESAVAQPTHEPVDPWSATFHQVARRSFEAGRGGAASTTAASAATSNVQSSSVFGEGSTFRMRLRRRTGWARPLLPRGRATGVSSLLGFAAGRV